MAEKKWIEEERRKRHQRMRKWSFWCASNSISSLGLIPMGKDGAIDATRLLLSTMVLFPKGKWHIDKLPVSINWGDIPTVDLADAVLCSGREDVLAQLPIDWTGIRLPSNKVSYSSGGVYPLKGDLRRQSSWLVSRVLSYEIGPFSEAYCPGPWSLYECQVNFLRSLESVGVGPDTLVSSHVLGKPGQSRLVDVSLVYSCPLVQDRLLSTASWDSAQQSEDTLWALAARFAVSDHIDLDSSQIPPSLKNGKLVRSLLALSPDPEARVSLLPSVSLSLGLIRKDGVFLNEFIRQWAKEEGYDLEEDPLEETSIPLAFAMLLLIHANDTHQPRVTDRNAKMLSKWCVKKIISTPKLLEGCVEGLILPALRISHFPGVKSDSGSPHWSFTSIIEELLPFLDQEDQKKVFVAGFEWFTDVVSHQADDLPSAISDSFPFSCPLSQGVLDIEQAQDLLKAFSKIDMCAWSFVEEPGFADSVFFSAFDPAVSASLRDRIMSMGEQASSVFDLPESAFSAAQKKIQLLAQVPLTRSGNPRSPAPRI